MKIKQSVLTSTIIQAFYGVNNQPGYSFLEEVDKNALAHELRKRVLNVK